MPQEVLIEFLSKAKRARSERCEENKFLVRISKGGVGMIHDVFDAIYKRFVSMGLRPLLGDVSLRLANLDSDYPTIIVELEPRVQVAFYRKNDAWFFIVWKLNKNGTINKRVEPDHFSIYIQSADGRNPEVITDHFCDWILKIDKRESVSEILSDSSQFGRIRNALQKEKALRARVQFDLLEKQRQQNAREGEKRVYWVIGIIFVLVILFGQSSVPEGCSYIPDPRGGYVDC